MNNKNKVRFSKESAFLHFDQRNVVQEKFKVSAFKHYTIWRSALKFLKKRGFTVHHDKETLKNYPILNSKHRYAKKELLECNLEIYPIGFKLEFYQNVNFENRNGGRYDFDKFKKMPYAIKLSFLNELNHLIKYFSEAWHCEIEFIDSPDLAVDQIVHHFFRRSSFTRNKITDISQIESMMDKYDIEYNNRDRDKKIIKCGEIKYFRDWDGYLSRGVVYHNINNMWWVVVNKYTLNNIVMFNLFDPTPEDFKHRRLKAHKPPAEYVKKMELLSSIPAKWLKNSLKKRLSTGVNQ